MRFSKKNIRLQNQKKSQINKKHRNLKGGANFVKFVNLINKETFFLLRKLHQNFDLYSEEERAKLNTILTEYDICLPPNTRTGSEINFCHDPRAFQAYNFASYDDLYQRINNVQDERIIVPIRPKTVVPSGSPNVINLNYSKSFNTNSYSMKSPTHRYEYDSHWTNVEILDRNQRFTQTEFIFDSGNDGQTSITQDVVDRLGLERKPKEAKIYSIRRLIDILELLEAFRITFNQQQIPKFGLQFNTTSFHRPNTVSSRNSLGEALLEDLRNARFCKMTSSNTNDGPVLLRDLLDYVNIICDHLYSSSRYVPIILAIFARIIDGRHHVMPDIMQSKEGFKNLFIKYLGIDRAIGIGGYSPISLDYVELLFKFTGHDTTHFTVRAEVTRDETYEVLISVHTINKLKEYNYIMTHKKHREYDNIRRTHIECGQTISSIEALVKCPDRNGQQSNLQINIGHVIPPQHIQEFLHILLAVQANEATLKTAKDNFQRENLQCIAILASESASGSEFSSQSQSPPPSLGASVASSSPSPSPPRSLGASVASSSPSPPPSSGASSASGSGSSSQE
jgi:hypothetical protein